MLRILHWAFRAVGSAPNNSKADKYFTVAALILFLVSAEKPIVQLATTDYDSHKAKLHLASLTSFYITGFIHIVKTYVNKLAFAKLWSELISLGCIVENGASNRKFETYVVLGFIVFAPLRFVSYLTALKEPFVSFGRLFATSYLYLQFLQHVVIVRHLTSGFSALNDNLRATAVKSKTSSISTLRKELNIIFRNHVDLRYLVAKVNSHYGCFYVLFMASQLLFLLISIYTTLITLSDEKGLIDLIYLTSYCSLMSSILLPCLVCHACMDTAKQSVLIVHEMVDTDSPVELMEEVKMFSLGMYNNPVRFSAAGVFYIGRPFITRAGAMIISYLIIAIQLKDANLSGASATSSADAVTPSANFTTLAVSEY